MIYAIFLSGLPLYQKEHNLKEEEEKVVKEKFCMCCKSKEHLQVSVNLLTDPAFLCSKCISIPNRKNKK